MGKVRLPEPVKLVVPMLAADEALFALAEEALCERYGPVDYRSPTLPFTHTDYYAREFGAGLMRRFIAFERLIDPGQLPEIKRWTNDLEARWSVEGRRRINLDPGYISLAKLVLATTKDHGHRIYVGQGIYAEVTLSFRGKDFQPWPWTYPDYASEAYRAILRAIRDVYMRQLRGARAPATYRGPPRRVPLPLCRPNPRLGTGSHPTGTHRTRLWGEDWVLRAWVPASGNLRFDTAPSPWHNPRGDAALCPERRDDVPHRLPGH